MNYWLIKTEAECYSIDDLKRDRRIPWEGVRNYTARNFMRDSMKVGDIALFYHSNTDMGIYGLAKVVSKPHPDLSAQNKRDEHYDPKATKENPIWYCVDFAFLKKFKTYLSLPDIKADQVLSGMVVAQKGSRLSITPVSEKQYKRILELLGQ
ncbi:MAG: EVE domain-containing protein [Candidatus Paceibacterota bacterium]|jgi:predicted RNA-binding protein with PUA-like domain